MPGQPRATKLNSDQTTEMLAFAARPPSQQAQSILTQGPQVMQLGPNNATLVSRVVILLTVLKD